MCEGLNGINWQATNGQNILLITDKTKKEITD